MADRDAIARDLADASGTGTGNLIAVLKDWWAKAERAEQAMRRNGIGSAHGEDTV